MIIYPPFIGETIPAFVSGKIVIPFSQNPAVSINEVTSFKLIIKDYLNSNIIASSIAIVDDTHLIYNSDTKSGEVIFTEFIDNNTKEEWTPTSKQYYKFQMSYSDDSTYNAYSSVSIGRCIGEEPRFFVIGDKGEMDSRILNLATRKFIGRYSTSISSEPLYSYRFFVKDLSDNTILQDTTTLIHNTDNDEFTRDNKTRISQHEFVLRYELEQNKQYLLTYEITTINGFTSKKEYIIIKSGKLPMPFNGSLYVNQDEKAIDNGYINIVLIGSPCKGEFILERTNDGKEWVELTQFSLTELSDLGILDGDKLVHKGNFVWKDWSVEQGVKYTYAISQYFENNYSERKLSKGYTVDFEHMFLSDGKRQLKIAYNPKVSSFKDTILEQKTDTIGSNYPFFFRNNQIKYKEIPISGLISYQMDKDNLFIDNEDLGLVEISTIRESTSGVDNFEVSTSTTNLVGYNYTAERKFKLSVLEWLTNGELKLFRSPAEGNYVVRLMNTSLAPNDTLGRMLHTFNSTAYEAAAADINTLLDKNLIKWPKLQDPDPSKAIITIKFSDIENLNRADQTIAKSNKINNQIPYHSNSIENIQWFSAKPNYNEYIKLDNEIFYNTTGIFTTPKGITYDSVVIGKINENNSENYGSTITFEYLPDLIESQGGEDIFEKMIKESTDIIFSAPTGIVLHGPDGILNIEEDIEENIYRTYILVAYRDINYTESDDFKLTFSNYDNLSDVEVIDCSDGQIRYYYNIDSNIRYEKTKGLHLDIYARVSGTYEAVAARLGEFILGISKLGG